MAHSSLFHWVTALGRQAPRHLNTLHADFVPTAGKYTSARRRAILINCQATCSALLLGQRPIAQPEG